MRIIFFILAVFISYIAIFKGDLLPTNDANDYANIDNNEADENSHISIEEAYEYYLEILPNYSVKRIERDLGVEVLLMDILEEGRYSTFNPNRESSIMLTYRDDKVLTKEFVSNSFNTHDDLSNLPEERKNQMLEKTTLDEIIDLMDGVYPILEYQNFETKEKIYAYSDTSYTNIIRIHTNDSGEIKMLNLLMKKIWVNKRIVEKIPYYLF